MQELEVKKLEVQKLKVRELKVLEQEIKELVPGASDSEARVVEKENVNLPSLV